ncbi:MAG: GcvH upstream region-like protein [Chlamydiales bacterium]|jgi:GcvH upstream region-like protein
MLGFFRKYQKIFFFFVTGIIFVTFIFFGTFQTTPRDIRSDKTVFKAVDGSNISRGEVQAMTVFLSTDASDQESWGVIWGPNFLNDGVIAKDMLQSGLAQMLAKTYMGNLKEGLEVRQKKEKGYVPYEHPQANFLSSRSVWAYFAPSLNDTYDELLQSSSRSDTEKFDLRVRLFLEEKKFPSGLLRHVLRLQEQQYGWVNPDPYLGSQDLSLFGYKTVEDWFGRRFMELVSQFIINASAIAEQRGYEVSKEEALADLIGNGAISFEKNRDRAGIGVTNNSDYFNEQLRRLGIDKAGAVAVWRKVMLFRRLFNDIGNAVFVDAFSYEKFQGYAKEKVLVDLYQLPSPLRISEYRDLQKLETYLDIVSSKKRTGKMALGLPGDFLRPDEVERDYPELIARRFLLRVAHVNKSSLEIRVGLKETWNWQMQDENWGLLGKYFPELTVSKAKLREERFAVLENLDANTRIKVDAFARETIVNTHPEWLNESLELAKDRNIEVNISSRGGLLPFEGLQERKSFIELLDVASRVEGEKNIPQALEAAEELLHFTANNKDYYRIVVLDRDSAKRVLTFAEAKENFVLDGILDVRLEEHYKKMQRRSLPKVFLTEKSAARPFNEVKGLVADDMFGETLQAIYNDYLSVVTDEAQTSQASGNFCAPKRLFYFVRLLRDLMEDDPKNEDKFLQAAAVKVEEGRLPPLPSLSNQWKLERVEQEVARKSQEGVASEMAFSLEKDVWSRVFAPAHGDIHYFQVRDRIFDEGSVLDKVDVGQKVLSNEARRFLMEDVLETITSLGAISLDVPAVRDSDDLEAEVE